MSRAWQMERLMDREEAALDKQYADGLISREEYNAEIRNLQREYRAAYEEDLYEARRAVQDEWGW